MPGTYYEGASVYNPPQQQQRPRTGPIVWVILGVVVVAVAVLVWVLWPASKNQEPSAGPLASGAQVPSSAKPSGARTPCEYTRSSDAEVAKNVGMPDNAEEVPATGFVQITLKTDQGDIPLKLDRAKAPCTVQSMVFLAGKKYYDGTPCHRLTVIPNFKVLQCGDPGGTGRGGPGYKFDDELPTDLKPAQGTGGPEQASVYPKGVIAMANSGPNTNGSQFFLVYGDTFIPPNYTVFGTYTDPGQATLDKIAAGGVAQTESSLAEGDGAPKTKVTIQQVVTG
ncbi:peptidylprolyl isomerase [Actinocrispum sp. NPDC049592]|uniref:peptidylprolyl isomerase n=1 Tax=Actinocrispum sp. NPDC049592 TaxID=3154835 RepID=UPI003413C83C